MYYKNIKWFSFLLEKKHFHKNPLFFRIIADFEADNEIDNSSVGKKTTNFISKIHYVMVIV